MMSHSRSVVLPLAVVRADDIDDGVSFGWSVEARGRRRRRRRSMDMHGAWKVEFNFEDLSDSVVVVVEVVVA